jgi:hypothetical protein
MLALAAAAAEAELELELELDELLVAEPPVASIRLGRIEVPPTQAVRGGKMLAQNRSNPFRR